jgi:hypothetical protein
MSTNRLQTMLFRGCLVEGPTIRYLRIGQAVSSWTFFALTWRRLDKAVCAWGWVSCTHWEKGNFSARLVPGITSYLNVAALCGIKNASDGNAARSPPIQTPPAALMRVNPRFMSAFSGHRITRSRAITRSPPTPPFPPFLRVSRFCSSDHAQSPDLLLIRVHPW